MRFVTQMQCCFAKSRILYPFFTKAKTFKIQKTLKTCHTLKISTLPKFRISTSVVADGQFQTCTVQTWGCDWSGFKKDPLQDTERAFGWEAIFGEGSLSSLFGIVIAPGLTFFVDMIFIYIPCTLGHWTLGHWDIGYSLIWSILAAALFDILVSFLTNSLEVLHSFQIWVLHSCFWTFDVRRWISAQPVESWRRHR